MSASIAFLMHSNLGEPQDDGRPYPPETVLKYIETNGGRSRIEWLRKREPGRKPTPAASAIVSKFRARNIDPEGYTLYTYAAVQVWTQAAIKAGNTDPRKVMDVIKAGSWDTVIGKLECDAKGDIKQLDYAVYRRDDKGGYRDQPEPILTRLRPTHQSWCVSRSGDQCRSIDYSRAVNYGRKKLNV